MIVVDVETTGINPSKHSIVSIGAVYFNNPQNQFYEECRIWSGAEIERAALDVNGFTIGQVTDSHKKSLAQAIASFFEWTNDFNVKILAGHNIGFDMLFLKDSAERHGLNWPFHYRTVELHTLCYASHLGRHVTPPMKDGFSNLNLDAVLSYVGLPGERKPHNALKGAKAAAEAFSRLIHGRELLGSYAEYEVPAYLRRPE